jgi:hypothetical protein
MDPLTAFTSRGWDAPYLAEPPEFYWRASVVKVHPKTPYVASRRGGLAHLNDGVAAVFYDNAAQFAARFMCGHGSKDVAILPDASVYGGVCARCDDVAKGPGVYRCLAAVGSLLYIGSARAPMERLKIHKTQTPWWPEVADVKVERFPTIFEARAAEWLAIGAENPLYNKRRPAA